MSKPYLSTPKRESARRAAARAPRRTAHAPPPRHTLGVRAHGSPPEAAPSRGHASRGSPFPKAARTLGRLGVTPYHAPCPPRRPATANHRSIHCSGPGATPIKGGTARELARARRPCPSRSAGASEDHCGEPKFHRPCAPTIVPSTLSCPCCCSPSCSRTPPCSRLAGARAPAAAAAGSRGPPRWQPFLPQPSTQIEPW
jgi:hypothetical protein